MAQTEYGSADFDSTTVNAHRSGAVVARQLTNVGPQVQILFPDRGVTSDWLPVGQKGGKGTIFYFCPRIGDNVKVDHFATGIEVGTVESSNCTPQNPSFMPRSINSVAFQTDDRAFFEYNPDTGCLNINGVATLYFNAQGQIQIICGGDLDATVRGSLNATVTNNVKVSCTDLDATCSGEATITAPTIALKGNTTITGTLVVSGNVTVNGETTTVQNLQINGVESGGGDI